MKRCWPATTTKNEYRKMNSKTKSNRAEYAVRQTPKIKTLGLRLTVSRPNLEMEVRRAFDLAKSAGQELNLTFSNGLS